MATLNSCGALLQHSARLSTGASSTGAEKFPTSSCCGSRTPFGVTNSNWVRQDAAEQPTPPGCRNLALIQNPSHQHQKKLVPRGSRTLQYEDAMTYVLMEPGEDEQFLSVDELQSKLKSWLVKWPANELPEDLQQFESLDEVVTYLVESACELDLGGGLGSLQWFEETESSSSSHH